MKQEEFLTTLHLIIDDYIDAMNCSEDADEWLSDEEEKVLDEFYKYVKNFGKNKQDAKRGGGD